MSLPKVHCLHRCPKQSVNSGRRCFPHSGNPWFLNSSQNARDRRKKQGELRFLQNPSWSILPTYNTEHYIQWGSCKGLWSFSLEEGKPRKIQEVSVSSKKLELRKAKIAKDHRQNNRPELQRRALYICRWFLSSFHLNIDQYMHEEKLPTERTIERIRWIKTWYCHRARNHSTPHKSQQKFS